MIVLLINFSYTLETTNHEALKIHSASSHAAGSQVSLGAVYSMHSAFSEQAGKFYTAPYHSASFQQAAKFFSALYHSASSFEVLLKFSVLSSLF
jgi:hypothetical protein